MSFKLIATLTFSFLALLSSHVNAGSAIGIPVHATRCEGQLVEKDPGNLLVFLMHESDEIRFRLSAEKSGIEIGLCSFFYPKNVGVTHNSKLTCNIGSQRTRDLSAEVSRVDENSVQLQWKDNRSKNRAGFSFDKSALELVSAFELNLIGETEPLVELSGTVGCR